MNSHALALAQLAACLQEEREGELLPFPAVKLAETLTTAAKQYARVELKKLNEPLTVRDERQQRRAKDCILSALGNHNMSAIVSFDGDPRGHVVTLKLRSRRSNNMGGEDWGIA